MTACFISYTLKASNTPTLPLYTIAEMSVMSLSSIIQSRVVLHSTATAISEFPRIAFRLCFASFDDPPSGNVSETNDGISLICLEIRLVEISPPLGIPNIMFLKTRQVIIFINARLGTEGSIRMEAGR